MILLNIIKTRIAKLSLLMMGLILASSCTYLEPPYNLHKLKEAKTSHKDYNIQDGYVAGGYDVVAYFSKRVKRGKSNLVLRYQGVKFKFSNKVNYTAFKNNPQKYTPQFGGWCAYAMAKDKKVSINPETYLIKNKKLYLFYNAFFNNTLEKCKKEGEEKVLMQAVKNWAKQSTN